MAVRYRRSGRKRVVGCESWLLAVKVEVVGGKKDRRRRRSERPLNRR